MPGPAGPDGDRRQPEHAESAAGDLGPARPLAQRDGGDHDAERHLGLEHECGQAGRHAQVQGQVQERELAQAHEPANGGDRLERHGRALHEEARGHGDDREADRGEQQRRDGLHAPVDDDEVEAPQGGDEGGQAGVFTIHPASVAAPIMKHQLTFLPFIM